VIYEDPNGVQANRGHISPSTFTGLML